MTTVYSSKTVTGNDKDPKHREKYQTYREPLSHDFSGSDVSFGGSDISASEVDDLANDQFFYDQLEKNKPSTESNADVEHVHEKRRNPNHDVVYHGGNGHKRGKHRQKSANFQNGHASGLQDEDIFGDYGEMVMPDRDVEMHDTYERNTKESHVHGPAQYSYDGNVRPKKRRRPTCNNPNPIVHGTNSQVSVPHNHQPLQNHPDLNHQNLQHHKTLSGRHSVHHLVHEPVHKRQFERIMVTKKLSSPDELHAEIDKIFEQKNKHYDKRGHEKSHWELRIVPKRYDEHEEQQTN